MAPNPTSDTDPDATAQAFDELRGEVSLTRRAVEGLTAARERVPDYSVTLGTMTQALDAAVAALARIEASPAVRLSPAALTAEIVKAGAAARADDAKLVHETRDAMLRAIGRVDGIVERGQAADRQVRQRLWSAAAGALAGMLVWSVLPGMVARALSASWHVPEWMAARTLRVDEQLVDRCIVARLASQGRLSDRSRLDHVTLHEPSMRSGPSDIHHGRNLKHGLS